MLAIFPAQDCTRIVQGVAAIGLRARMMYPSRCGSENVLAAGGSTVEGSVVASGYVPYTDSTNADVAVYLSALRSYDAGLKPSLLSQAGFSDVLVLQRIMTSIRGVVTAAAVTKALRATNGQPGFMSHAYTCDGKQITLLQALCNTHAHISVVTNGRLKIQGDWIDTAPLAQLVG